MSGSFLDVAAQHHYRRQYVDDYFGGLWRRTAAYRWRFTRLFTRRAEAGYATMTLATRQLHAARMMPRWAAFRDFSIGMRISTSYLSVANFKNICAVLERLPGEIYLPRQTAGHHATSKMPSAAPVGGRFIHHWPFDTR